MKLKSPYLVKPKAKLKLSRIATGETGAFRNEGSAKTVLMEHREKLSGLQETFYASQQKALLIVLQGMDTAGKDGTISHIFSGINPQGCNVSSFKVPTPLEARHDFLWRVHAQVPPHGMIQIFNRSHYEDVLVPRVHKLIPDAKLRERAEDIVKFESMLHENDVVILKFFLHISREEQTRRLQSRIDTPDKHWKLSESDFREREFWPRYEEAYNYVIPATSRKHAPWFIIPSDHKWYRNVAISQILVEVMKSLKLKYPKPSIDPSKIQL
ncbi:polyphosphate kinase 2 family protein [Edaphobacter albus]|uniref:polyphosphate kinase 2 family protein n=1 Tax=Edaphobacter sp. 4G125 TaxID=2763071 RepID=UPI0016465609|nr:polyphosphate kinase 2 family protein [Edaphobacter sp. 4G125]QNI36424.1 polyphosphate kinase 2 family protein [Edaphobacter sp. 4G125]